jgi:hypothetical protein
LRWPVSELAPAFKENPGQVTNDRLVFFDCYQIDNDPDLIAVFITTLPIKDVPIVDGDGAWALGLVISVER